MADNFKKAKEIAAWKINMAEKWNEIEIKEVELPEKLLFNPTVGESYPIEVVIDRKGLDNCIGIELVVTSSEDGYVKHNSIEELNVVKTDGSLTYYRLDYSLKNAGAFKYAFRMFPQNSDLPHRQDFSYVRWF